MGLFGRLLGFGRKAYDPEVLQAIERAVKAVDPLLLQVSGYPDVFYQPVDTALAYARKVAASIPGPVTINREAYASDPLVHALFPTADFVKDALCSSHSMRQYHHACPAAQEVFALMGMRRCEKNMLGMELSGDIIRRDVPQKVIYFTSHTLECTAPTEAEARHETGWAFFDSLVQQVQKRITQRKLQKDQQLEKKNVLMARLHNNRSAERSTLEAELASTLKDLHSTICSLELDNYLQDFKAVLLHPEQFLRLEQTSMVLDNMGIQLEGEQSSQGRAVVFNDLFGFDRRRWTVTMVHCNEVRPESYSSQLEAASRRLVV